MPTSLDPELAAMASVQAALEPLDEASRERVLSWAASRFAVAVGVTNANESAATTVDNDVAAPADVGSIMESAAPTDGPARALVVGYWLQVVQGRDGWSGSDVNSALKNMGHGLANVTKTLDSLKSRKPALVMQTAKSGRAQQARKTYKLTTAGIAAVQAMIAAADERAS